MHPGNPRVSVVTRRWLTYLSQAQPEVLDEASLTLLWPALRECHQKHPGGLVEAMCVAMGGDYKTAEVVASVCELFYAACSLSDDIQDEDADKYMGITLALQVNAQGHLLALIAERIASIPVSGSEHKIRTAYKTLATMISGQRLEIVRNPWTIREYEIVAQMSAGTQVSWYMELAAWAARMANPDRLRVGIWGASLGKMLQVVWDNVEEDSRWFEFPIEDRKELLDKISSELMDSAELLTGRWGDVAWEVTRTVCDSVVD